MQTHVTVEGWVAMFRELGLTEPQMHEWHRIFESRFPDGHRSFLEWLGLPATEIERIRKESR